MIMFTMKLSMESAQDTTTVSGKVRIGGFMAADQGGDGLDGPAVVQEVCLGGVQPSPIAGQKRQTEVWTVYPVPVGEAGQVANAGVDSSMLEVNKMDNYVRDDPILGLEIQVADGRLDAPR